MFDLYNTLESYNIIGGGGELEPSYEGIIDKVKNVGKGIWSVIKKIWEGIKNGFILLGRKIKKVYLMIKNMKGKTNEKMNESETRGNEDNKPNEQKRVNNRKRRNIVDEVERTRKEEKEKIKTLTDKIKYELKQTNKWLRETLQYTRNYVKFLDNPNELYKTGKFEADVRDYLIHYDTKSAPVIINRLNNALDEVDTFTLEVDLVDSLDEYKAVYTNIMKCVYEFKVIENRVTKFENIHELTDEYTKALKNITAQISNLCKWTLTTMTKIKILNPDEIAKMMAI